jgi:hypothetical protein
MKEEIYSRNLVLGMSLWSTTLFILLLLHNSFAIAGELIEPAVQDKSLQLEITSAIPLNFRIEQSTKPHKGNPKLGSSLNKLLEKKDFEGLSAARTLARSLNMVLQDDRIQVTIVTSEGANADVRKAVEAMGGEYELHYGNLIQALVPISVLGVLAKRSDVHIIREPRRAILAQQTISALPAAGNQTTDGVAESNASVFHAAGYDGAGVRVAVIDSEFAGYAGLLGTDLPATVNTYDWTGTGMGGDPHGTACAEVVFDMAPGVTMDLHKVNTPVEFGNAVDRAIAQGTHIISASVLFPLDGPGDGTGFLADIVAYARSNGIFYAGASGNYAERSWSGIFTDNDSDDLHEWTTGQNINYFGPGDGLAYIIQPGYPIKVFLQWDDWVAVDQDYDMELYYWDGDSWEWVATASDVQNGGPGQQPFEYIIIPAPFEGVYGVIVVKSNASRDVCFRVIAPDLELDERVPARSFLFPADSPDVITVGAVDVTDPFPLEAYSSRGPTFGPGGSCSGGSVKPDVVGYAKVSTVSYGPGAFAGTSAATPHVAGAAALLKDAYSSSNAEQLQQLVEGFAVDLGVPGKDNLYGAGRLYLDLLIPIATTGPATSVTSASATLNGTVNPNGSTTTYYFEYGLTQSYGSTTTETDIGSGTYDIGVSAGITISDPIASYHYRLVATNTFGTVYGADMTFTNDTDADSMPDDWEMKYFGDLSHDGTSDSENDGLRDLQEYQNGTDPTNSDSDDDRLPDGWEVTYGLDPIADDAKGDLDGDRFNNLQEYLASTNPADDTSYPIPDFGDAPDPTYFSQAINNGAEHLVFDNEWLGEDVNGEADSIQVNTDLFDDGVEFRDTFLAGVATDVDIKVNVLDSTDTKRYDPTDPEKRLYLNAWFDWNGDGDWSDPGEKVIGTSSGIVYSGYANDTIAIDPTSSFGGINRAILTFSITSPVDWPIGGYARFRLDYGEDAGAVQNISDNLSEYMGAAQFGEVEDYRNPLLALSTIDVNGGNVTVINPGGEYDGCQVAIPAGALNLATDISIQEVPNKDALPATPDGGVSILIEIRPTGTIFNIPITITVPHDPSLEHSDSPQPYFWDEPNGLWSSRGISNIVYDESSDPHTVSFDVTHLTAFAVDLGIAPGAGTGAGGGGGGCFISTLVDGFHKTK